MKSAVRPILVLLFALLSTSANSLRAAQANVARQVLRADAGWKFSLGDPTGAEAPSFTDASWRTVDLPHDWSIEGAPDQKNATGSGGGYFPAGIGWYRKTVVAPASWKGKRVSIEFDGVASNATVYLNGQKLGIHPYAYTGFQFDLTSQLKLGQTNVLAVRVDCSEQPSSRWYSGSGIYRHVRVVITDPVHVAPWGVFVTTPNATSASAKVVVKTLVRNDADVAGEMELSTVIVNPDGTRSLPMQTHVTIAANGQSESSQEGDLQSPALWSPQQSNLYRAVTEIRKNGKIIDHVETTFGIRSLSWSVDKGLLLNGASIKLAGGSVHHDNGPLGAAAFDRAEVRKIELLKAAGFNAVRTAHNPPSPAFLDTCDRLGLLVLEDAFDVWTTRKAKYDYARFFDDWWQRDIDSMVLRDRNHPSIIFWGIGNEIQEAWTNAGAPIAQKLAARVRSLDPTRPLTEAFPGATFTPATDAVFSVVDVGGYNYNLAQNEGKDHERIPDRIMMTTESLPATAFEQWQVVHDHPYILGEFVWTAMDYLGESGIGSWSYATPEQAKQASGIAAMMKGAMATMGADGKNPFPTAGEGDAKPNPIVALLFPGFPWHAADCGDLDLTGYRKPQSYYRDILWNRGDRVFTAVRLPEPDGKKIVALGWSVYPSIASWTWPGHEGKPLTVDVYSGAESVRLYLNDKLIGEKTTGKDQEFKATFDVPYAPGKLQAEGLHAGRVVAEEQIVTTGSPVRLRLTPDRTEISADGQDLAFVTVEALDQQGRLQMNADQEVHFTIKGSGSIAGLGNGDGKSSGSYWGDTLTLFHGRALIVVRTSKTAGLIQLSATAAGLSSASVSLTSRPSSDEAELR